MRIERENLDAKLKAMRTQVSQTREGYLRHFEQMIEARATLWGAKFFGADAYAECFYIEHWTPIKVY